MGITAWYYAYDPSGRPRRLTSKLADSAQSNEPPPEVPRIEPGGILLAEVLLQLENGTPTAIIKISFIAIAVPESEAEGELVRELGLNLVTALASELRSDLSKRRVSPFYRMEMAAIEKLSDRIRSGTLASMRFRTWSTHLADAINSLPS